jgi:hypothetical protein
MEADHVEAADKADVLFSVHRYLPSPSLVYRNTL